MTAHKFIRDVAINQISVEYKGLAYINEKHPDWKLWLYEICAQYKVAHRTAVEYMRTAQARIRLAEKQAHAEVNELFKEIGQ